MESVPCHSLAEGEQPWLVGFMTYVLSHDQGITVMTFQSHSAQLGHVIRKKKTRGKCLGPVGAGDADQDPEARVGNVFGGPGTEGLGQKNVFPVQPH